MITSIAMFYDLEDPIGWLNQVRECLADDGIWICQMSYMPLMLKQNAFDNICHEHITYYTFQLMETILRSCGLEVVDVELNNVNGGSFRIYAKHEGAVLDAPAFESDIGLYRMSALRNLDTSLALQDTATYEGFARRIDELRWSLIHLLLQIREKGQIILGYGAVLPWHFLTVFVQRERALLDAGTRFVVPLPSVQIVGPDGLKSVDRQVQGPALITHARHPLHR